MEKEIEVRFVYIDKDNQDKEDLTIISKEAVDQDEQENTAAIQHFINVLEQHLGESHSAFTFGDRHSFRHITNNFVLDFMEEI